MSKSSRNNADRKEVIAALNARIDLLQHATALRAGDPTSCAVVAELLEKIAMGADASAVLIHPKQRVRQKSETELHNRFIAILTTSQSLGGIKTAAAEAEVTSHIGSMSGETVRQAYRQFHAFAKQRFFEEIEGGRDLQEWRLFVNEVRRLMVDIKKN